MSQSVTIHSLMLIIVVIIIIIIMNLCRKISLQSCNDRDSSLLFQQLSNLIQQFSAILLHDSFVHEED